MNFFISLFFYAIIPLMKNTNIDFKEIDSYIKSEFRYEIRESDSTIKEPIPDYAAINDYISSTDDLLQEKIRQIIQSKNLDEVKLYKKANVDRKLFSKIRTLPDYHPNKNTLVKLCLAMNLGIEESESLLKTAGYSLSKSVRQDLLLRYCFCHKIFDVITVNEILDHYGEKII